MNVGVWHSNWTREVSCRRKSVKTASSYVGLGDFFGVWCLIFLTFSKNLSSQLFCLSFQRLLSHVYNIEKKNVPARSHKQKCVNYALSRYGVIMFSSRPFAGDEWCNFTAGVCGGVRRPVPDVWRLPPCGSQGLLEGRGSGSAEGRCLCSFSWTYLFSLSIDTDMPCCLTDCSQEDLLLPGATDPQAQTPPELPQHQGDPR